jgi:7-cyano-7-deazaguanine synthase
MNRDSPQVLVLVSGGIDSSACVAFFKTQPNSVAGMFVDYGQLSAAKELHAASQICRHFGVHLTKIHCLGVKEKGRGCIRGRNGLLVSLALTEVRFESGIIALGIHSGTDYWDCSAEFVRALQTLIDGYTDGRIRLELPFLQWNKREIWEFCREMGIPLELTYSCELGLDQPCGRCSSCQDLEALRALPLHAHNP